ncbi:MAG: hypothetical protein N3F62_04315 [Bacteroidia bacterium]|jgi:hypothetical protein|nr:hypothetical protein [Bacteroidia bacterium]
MKFFSKIIAFSIMLFCFNQLMFGAAPPPPGGGGRPPCWPPPCIPIDGGVSILIAAGALYGAKKSYDKFKSARNSRQSKDSE